MSPIDGAKIRRLRDKLDLSQDELAERTGIRQPTISAIERGTASHATAAHLEKIARALGVSPARLLRK
jgi:transcriptional regulator with XRE-family HTH domain